MEGEEEEEEDEIDYMASCITFISPNQVPAGKKYHVRQFFIILG